MGKLKSKSTKTLILILSIFLISSISADSGQGHQDHGDKCDPRPTQTDLSLKCDSTKRLDCDPGLLVCRCHHEDRDSYDETSGRCETKVGKFCQTDSVCVGNAVCNKTTNFCECQDGFETNDDGSKCSGAFQTESSSIFMSSMAMFLLLISVFICT